jgi:hypothetical protein
VASDAGGVEGALSRREADFPSKSCDAFARKEGVSVGEGSEVGAIEWVGGVDAVGRAEFHGGWLRVHGGAQRGAGAAKAEAVAREELRTHELEHVRECLRKALQI